MMRNLFSLNKIYIFSEKTLTFIKSVFPVLLVVGLTFALVLSPPDYLQGDVVRIMYVHVPSAWIALGTFSTLTILSIINFIFKIKILEIVNLCIAPIGLLFTCLAIITGSIWAEPTWGTWWAWDARLTSMIVLMFFYAMIIYSQKHIKPKNRSLMFTSLISIIGAINIPIIKYSVEWWNTLHQPASIKITGETSIHSSMLMPLMLMLLIFLLYSALIFLMKYKTEIIKVKGQELKDYDRKAFFNERLWCLCMGIIWHCVYFLFNPLYKNLQ